MSTLLQIIITLELLHASYSTLTPTSEQFEAQIEIEAQNHSLMLRNSNIEERSLCQSQNILVINMGHLNATRNTAYMVWGSAGPILSIYAIREGGLFKIAQDQGEDRFDQICKKIKVK